MQILIDFFSLTDPNVRSVVLGTILMTSSGAIVGSLALLKQKALLGDAIAHAVFPGVCLAFMITGDKHPVYLTLSAFVTSWLALWFIDILTEYTKIKEDTAIALVLSIAFGLGALLLSIIQNSGNPAQLGLNNFLFGKTAALLMGDLSMLSLLSCLVITLFIVCFKEFTLIAFDKTFAHCIGLPVRLLEFLSSSLMVLAVIVGIRAIGIVLMAATLITPAAATRFWTDRFPKMVLLSALLGAVAGISGSFISYIAPGMPTGPWIVLCITFIAYSSFLLAPQKGLLARRWRRYQHQRKILTENILKIFYELDQMEKERDSLCSRSVSELLQHRPMMPRILMKGLTYLHRRGLVQRRGAKWCLTGTGRSLSQEVSQRHQLWKLYLTQYLRIKPDHVHEDAESIEHIITPPLIKELKDLLKHTSESL